MRRREAVLFAVGRPFSSVYGLAMRWRARLYATGVLPRYRLPVPVVSIGNLTWGGTGKTPMVAAVAAFLAADGRRPVVVSRGYGGKTKAAALVVGDGRQVLADPAEAGDEPCHLARRLAGVPVIVARRRLAGALLAIDRFDCDVVVLDDGFQHLALARDVDIVLFRAADPLGNGRVFPGGPLREPMDALSRADCFVATGGDWPENLAQQLAKRHPSTPRFTAPVHPRALVVDGEERDTSHLRGRRVVGFCGIANPASFRRLLEQCGAVIADWLEFPDHHSYQPADLEEIGRRLAACGADLACTTEKDLVKISHPFFPLAALAIDLAPPPEFFAFVRQRLSSPGIEELRERTT